MHGLLAEMLQNEARRITDNPHEVRNAEDALKVLCLDENGKSIDATLKTCVLSAMRQSPNVEGHLNDAKAVMSAGNILMKMYQRSSQLIHDEKEEVIMDGEPTKSEERLVHCIAGALALQVRVVSLDEENVEGNQY
jgi:hypothetical protein